jgi:SAM-dependent methyltransferase
VLRARAPFPGEPGPGKHERCAVRDHARTIAHNPGVTVSPYDAIARLYDPWSRSVTEDMPFYLEEARRAAGPVVELGVGTGRIAVPIAAEGIHVIGVDSSRGMLDVCREHARLAGVEANVDLRPGDLRDPPVDERVELVICPFRSLLHMQDHEERRGALSAVRDLLIPGGRFVFDVFAPSLDDVEETQGRWLEREPGIWERADWDVDARTLRLSVRGAETESTMALAWLDPEEWRTLLEASGFAVEACYGWFDRTPYTGGEDTIWIARRR